MKVLFAFALSMALSATLLAQTASEVFETVWRGASTSRSEVTESGYFNCTEKLYDIAFDDDDNTFTGKAFTNFNLDGVDYACEVYISGTFDPEDFSVVISTGSFIRKDELPGGLYWISTTLYLTVYADSDHSGYYILSGKTSGQTYSDELYEVGSYPY